MEGNSTEKVDFTFLLGEDSERLFSDLDYLLKDGVHIQDFGEHVEYYAYLQKHWDKLNNYYQRLFGVNLERKGASPDQYYFLDYHSKERSKIPDSHRNPIKNEYIIIGFIIYKIIYFDGNVELNSIEKLKQKITLDYEQYESGLIRLIAKSGEGGKLSEDDLEIDKVVAKALSQFQRLGWLQHRGDYFELLPSFQRLLYLYEDVIRNINHIIAKYK